MNMKISKEITIVFVLCLGFAAGFFINQKLNEKLYTDLYSQDTINLSMIGEVWRKINENFVFEDKIVGGAIPREYIPSVQAGVKESLDNGVIAGYPVMNIRVRLIDGSYHPVDSSDIAFKIAGSLALRDAIKKSQPILLEPVMKVQIITPKDYLGDVIGDMSARRGKIEGIESKGELQVINAQAPLASLFGYATALRSVTQGRATYTMQFSHYDEVPENMMKEIIDKLS